jgi:hypothetical protein
MSTIDLTAEASTICEIAEIWHGTITWTGLATTQTLSDGTVTTFYLMRADDAPYAWWTINLDAEVDDLPLARYASLAEAGIDHPVYK